MIRPAAKDPYLIDSVMGILAREGIRGVSRTRVRKVPAATLQRIISLHGCHKGWCRELLAEQFQDQKSPSPPGAVQASVVVRRERKYSIPISPFVPTPTHFRCSSCRYEEKTGRQPSHCPNCGEVAASYPVGSP